MQLAINLSILLALFLDTSVVADQKIGLCCLCSGCGPAVSGRGNFKVNQYGKTCTQLILEMADPSNGSKPGNSQCVNLKSKYYNTCCNPNYKPVPVGQAPTPSPRSKYPKGPYPWCNLCKNGGKPTKPYTVTAVKGIPGNPTCLDLYYMGQQGSISDQMCKPMQWYMQGPCGCSTTTSGQASSNRYLAEGEAGEDTVYKLTEEMIVEMPQEE